MSWVVYTAHGKERCGGAGVVRLRLIGSSAHRARGFGVRGKSQGDSGSGFLLCLWLCGAGSVGLGSLPLRMRLNASVPKRRDRDRLRHWWLRGQGEGGSKLRAEGGQERVAKSTVVLSASNLGAGADGKVAAQAQFSMQKAARYFISMGRITCVAQTMR